MKLIELEKLFNEKCVFWRRMHDLGDRIIYSVGFTISGNILVEQGVTVYVRNRGTELEEVYFVGGVPAFMVTPPEPHPLEKAMDEIIAKCGLSIVEGFNVNPTGSFAIVTGYAEVGVVMVRKQYIAYIKSGEIIVKEVGE